MNKRDSLPFELTNEQFDDIKDCVSRAYKNGNDWKSLYGVASTVEDYLSGYVNLHFHAMVSVGLDAPNFCAVFERHPLLDLDVPNHRRESGVIGITLQSEPSRIKPSSSKASHLDGTMLVGVVYLVKKPKNTVPLPIPSVIRLQLLDSCPVFRLEKSGGILPPAMGFATATVWPIDANQEGHIFDSEAGLRLRQKQLASQQIESGTQIVDNLTNRQRPIDRERVLLLSPEAKAEITRVTVTLGYNNTIAVSLNGISHDDIEGFDLFPGPFDLSKYSIEWMHDVDSAKPQPASQSRKGNNEQ